MVTGSTHATDCATQPIHATVTDNYAQNSMHTITLTKIPSLNFKIPRVFQVLQVSQSCMHPVNVINVIILTFIITSTRSMLLLLLL